MLSCIILPSHLWWKKRIVKGTFYTMCKYPFFMLTEVQIVERVMSQVDWVFREHQKTPRQRIPHELIPWDVGIDSVLDYLTNSNRESVNVPWLNSVRWTLFPVSIPSQICLHPFLYKLYSHSCLYLTSRGQCWIMLFMQNQHCFWQLTWRHITKWVLMMRSIFILVLISPDSPCQIDSA